MHEKNLRGYTAVRTLYAGFISRVRSVLALAPWPLLVTVALAAAACSSESAPTLADSHEYNGIFFPRQKAVVDVMDAILIGQLVEVEGCLRINNGNNESSYVPVWPFGYSLNIANGVIEVLDAAGQVKARVGDDVFVGGGEIKSLEGVGAIDEDLRRALSTRCQGPYWFVGTEVRLVAQEVLVRSEGSNLFITNKTEARIYYFVVGRRTAALINWAPHTNLDQSIAEDATVKISHKDIYRSESEKEAIVYWWHAVQLGDQTRPGEIQSIIVKL